MNLGTIIKEARLERKYTQEHLADIIGVRKSSIAKWESGNVSEIKRSNLKKLSDALQIEPYTLLGINYMDNEQIVLNSKIEQQLIIAFRDADAYHRKLTMIALGMEET